MFHDYWKKKNYYLNYFTEWFWPILWGKVQKLRPIIKLLRQGITKLQKGKKRLNAFDLYSSFLMLSWYIVANGLLYDSTFLLQIFWRVVQQSYEDICIYLFARECTQWDIQMLDKRLPPSGLQWLWLAGFDEHVADLQIIIESHEMHCITILLQKLVARCQSLNLAKEFW